MNAWDGGQTNGMRLFRRGRHRRAPATITSVTTTDRTDRLCSIDVVPPLAPRFESTLRTRLEVVPGAETFVLFDPDHHEECVLDEERLSALGAKQGRAYVRVGAAPVPAGRMTLADSTARLRELDHLSERHDRGELTDAEFAAERTRVLCRPD